MIGGNGHHAQVLTTGLDGGTPHMIEIEPDRTRASSAET